MDLKVKNAGAAQSADELFDVVDERDVVVGQERRGEVHARGLRHRAVHVFCFDAEGRVFLQRRSLAKDSAPGRWCASCSGHVDAGEDYDAAAVRELREEIGVTVEASELRRWLRLEPSRETGMEFVWVYRVQHAGPFTLNPAEVMGGGWYTPEELEVALRERAREFAGSFRYVWAQLEGGRKQA
jgi:isopentenyl-diphosphate Delta-isomerase